MAHLLVVCTANVCRSPVVDALLKDRVVKAGYRDWTVSSAGTWALETRPASRFSRELLLEWEALDISDHRAKMVDQDQMDAADLILCMEKGHAEALKIEFRSAAERIFLLSEMATGHKFNIADPYGTPKHNYEHMVREVRQLVEEGLPRIIELAGKFEAER